MVLRLSNSEELGRIRNQVTSLVGAGIESNLICRNFYELSYESGFQTNTFFAINMNHKILAETVKLGKIDAFFF